MQQSTKNSLVCLAGKSPQIVTEALYSLAVGKRIRIDEICLLTTDECRDDLFGSLSPEIEELTKLNSLKRIEFRKENILSAKEDINSQLSSKNSPLTELIFETIRQKKEQGYRLHCFISGGRKTMSVDLAIALTIYGTDEDKLFHVVASPKFEQSKNYFPATSIEAKELVLVEKPFIKLRHRAVEIDFKASASQRIDTLVKTVQNELDSSVSLPSMTIHTSDRRIKIAEKEFRFQPLVFAIYLFFAKQSKFVAGGKNFSKAHSEALWKIYEKVSPSYGHSERVARSGYEHGRIDFGLIQKSVSIVRNKFVELFEQEHISEFYSISTEGTYADKRYGIRLPKSKIKIVK